MTEQDTTKVLVALLIATALVLAAPSVGLVGVVQADDSDDEQGTKEFSRLFGKNEDKEKDKNKKPTKDPEGDSPFPDLDIKDYGFEGEDAYVQVYGAAGETLGAENEAIAYVLNIITEGGEEQTWAVDSHERQHGDSGTGEEWHGHRVHLTDNLATPELDATCLNEVDEVTHAMMDGDRAIFEDMKGNDIQAERITSAATVRLQLQVDDPDNPPPGTPCIALVVQVYDTADLTKRE